VLSSDDIIDILDECERYLPQFDCPKSYLTLNAAYLKDGRAEGEVGYGVLSLLMGVSGTSSLTCDEQHIYGRFRSSELLPLTVHRRRERIRHALRWGRIPDHFSIRPHPHDQGWPQGHQEEVDAAIRPAFEHGVDLREQKRRLHVGRGGKAADEAMYEIKRSYKSQQGITA
jgi:hypothetical protein